MEVVFPVPLTPTTRITLGRSGSGRSIWVSRGKILTISSLATATTFSAVSLSGLACNWSRMRVVIGTPRSERISNSSNSSQSTGRPAKRCTRDFKNVNAMTKSEGKLEPARQVQAGTQRGFKACLFRLGSAAGQVPVQEAQRLLLALLQQLWLPAARREETQRAPCPTIRSRTGLNPRNRIVWRALSLR